MILITMLTLLTIFIMTQGHCAGNSFLRKTDPDDFILGPK